MRVKWSDHALAQRKQVADCIRDYFGAKHKILFLQEVRRITGMLKRSPNVGSIDPLFADRSVAYRSVIINGLSKMVHYVKDDTIRIAGFWDTRCEPEAQAEFVKE